jgi:hypothetical protein
VAWQAESDKMRNVYKATNAEANVPTIVEYLVTLNATKVVINAGVDESAINCAGPRRAFRVDCDLPARSARNGRGRIDNTAE